MSDYEIIHVDYFDRVVQRSNKDAEEGDTILKTDETSREDDFMNAGKWTELIKEVAKEKLSIQRT